MKKFLWEESRGNTFGERNCSCEIVVTKAAHLLRAENRVLSF